MPPLSPLSPVKALILTGKQFSGWVRSLPFRALEDQWQAAAQRIQTWLKTQAPVRGSSGRCHGARYWTPGIARKDWQVVSDGYGTVTFDPVRGIVMTPKAASPSDPDGTHASLLLSTQTLRKPLKDFEATVTFTNEAQLREGAPPNAWEVFWLLFNYTLDDAGKKKTNYVTVKPTGLEVGTAFDEVGQEFLLTNPSPAIQVGQTHTMKVSKTGQRVKIVLDGKPVADFESTGDLYDVPGALGLYCEDARVRVHRFTVKPLTPAPELFL